MLDLMGHDVRLPRHIAAVLAEHGRASRITVCSRRWGLLEPLEQLDGVRVVHSVGNRRQLAALTRRFAGGTLAGVSIHSRLLDAATVRELRDRAALVMSWPVESAAEARRLAAWGVQGLITSRYAELAPLFSARPDLALTS